MVNTAGVQGAETAHTESHVSHFTQDMLCSMSWEVGGVRPFPTQLPCGALSLGLDMDVKAVVVQ